MNQSIMCPVCGGDEFKKNYSTYRAHPPRLQITCKWCGHQLDIEALRLPTEQSYQYIQFSLHEWHPWKDSAHG